MYLGTNEQKIKSAIVARNVVDLAGLDPETALVPIQAASDAQKNFAGDVRLYAIAQMWNEDIQPEYQTQGMAKALVSACNRHSNAKFWLDNKQTVFISLLEDDIEAELGE